MTHDQRRFFDPTCCPNCRGPLPAPIPGLSCPQCGVALTSPTGIRLAGLLRDADRTLELLRRERVTPARAYLAAAQLFQPRASGFAPSSRPDYLVPPLPTAPLRRRSISPAAILLGLGGLCLVVAAVVFLSVSWTALTLGEKVAVLGGVTVLLGSAAGIVTRRLRGSAETLWAITYADLALDVVAARRADLLGLRTLPLHLFIGLGVGLVAIVALAGLIVLRPTRLIASQLSLAVAGSIAISSILTDCSLPTWLALGAYVLTIGALALGVRRAGWTVAAITAGSIAMLPWLSLIAAGAYEILHGDYAAQLLHGRAWELPLATVFAVVTAAVPGVLRLKPLRIVAATAGLLTFELGLIATAYSYLSGAAALAVGLGAALLAGLAQRAVWRTAAALTTAALASVTAPVLIVAAALGIGAGLGRGGGLWHSTADYRLAGAPYDHTLALLALLAVAALAAGRYLTAQRAWIAATVVILAVAVGLNAHPPAWLAVAGWLAAAVVAAVLAQQPAQLTPAAVALALGLVTALPSDINSGWAYLLGTFFAVVVARKLTDPALTTVAELAAPAQLLVAVSAVVHTVSPQDGTPAVAGLLSVAAVCAVAALVSPSRRWWQWLAAAAATGAIWTEAAVRQLHAPELYCVPLGIIVLAFGLRESRRRELSSWLSYGPGLLILTAPTAVLAVAEPLSWRAGVIGSVALFMVLAGSKFKLQSPLLIGAVELGLLVLRELGPYAMALPRWAGIAAVGLVLLGTGITWENRLANVKQVRRQLAELN